LINSSSPHALRSWPVFGIEADRRQSIADQFPEFFPISVVERCAPEPELF
jgi:hypothetical protein